ncbi:zinc-dependent metalloprotease [Roseofilum casamattae]|uniref:Zinc-dependent metalloprotease n=1 Tax=Roseofilum casamattae BLCC-M143 TaxID=3022442 RepID=A0ABT7C2S0_9CYAN|nr:zinc-dependent metalloprotease [Roseofilum casamattae]MDJ1185739.1 zinc-dependent metalloprotease [Roseofilum casamattae BLCC-M143]
MKRFYIIGCILLGLIATFVWPSVAISIPPGNNVLGNSVSTVTTRVQTIARDLTSTKKAEKKKSFESIVDGARRSDGLFPLYQTSEDRHLYLEIAPEQLDRNFLSVMTLSSGIGEGVLLNGMPLGQTLFQFRHVQDKIQFVVPQTNFRTTPGDPLQRSLDRGFSDSVLYSFEIESTHPQTGAFLIDMSELLMGDTDLSGISSFVSPYTPSPDNSYISQVQNFPENLEIEATYGFIGSGAEFYIPSLPDSRAFNLAIHYSFSELPTDGGYRPRLADERIGYILTAYKDFGNSDRRDPFVRYINRWHVEPGKPVVFWIENTVPTQYRDAVREGALMWNEAFAKAGLPNAIEVRQMPDNADWDPADVRYNVIRWSSSFQLLFAGLGPSRTNPLTGEILDADILIDANIVRLIKGEYQTLVDTSQLANTANPLYQLCRQTWQKRYGYSAHLEDLSDRSVENTQQPSRSIQFPFASHLLDTDICFAGEFNQQFAIGSTALSLTHNVLPSSAEMEDYVNQFIRFLVAHEVGHTLGLRHNFHGSTLLSPEELQDPEITRTVGMVGSVMDYVPPNLAPPGEPQGDYFATKVGPYDVWAIEYGYTPIDAVSPQAELAELRQIAQRSAEPDLAFGTDEDAWSDLDPAVNRFDLSSDPMRYSQWQLRNAQAMWSRLNRRSPAPGESFSEMRDLFEAVFFYYLRNAMNLTLYVGGQSFNRDYSGDPNGRLPFQPISAERQREALATLSEFVFAEGVFDFSPQLLNQLAPSRWMHWGVFTDWWELDYPISDRLLILQRIVLRSLLDPTRLSRIQDLELKADSSQTAFMLPELFSTLQEDIWTEVIDGDFSELSSIRRGLQREYVKALSRMTRRQVRVPEDAVTLAWYNLQELQDDIDRTLRRQGKHLDTYTKAHLQKTRDRIAKVLDAPLESKSQPKASVF